MPTNEELEQKINDLKEKLEKLEIPDTSELEELLKYHKHEGIDTARVFSILTRTEKTDLTDGGATTLHKHDHGGMDGLAGDDHSQYHTNARGDVRYIKKDGTTSDISADIPLNNNKLTGVKDPTANQDAATKKWVEDNPSAEAFAPGDVAFYSDDTEKPTDGASSWTTIKEIVVGAGGGFRISFQMKMASGGQTIYGQIWRDGSPVGTERSQPANGYGTYQEDISGGSAGEVWSLMGKSSGGGRIYFRYYRLKVASFKGVKTEV